MFLSSFLIDEKGETECGGVFFGFLRTERSKDKESGEGSLEGMVIRFFLSGGSEASAAFFLHHFAQLLRVKQARKKKFTTHATLAVSRPAEQKERPNKQ